MAKVQIGVGRSTARDAEAAAGEIMAQIGGDAAKVAFAFIPSSWDQGAYHRALRGRLPKTTRLVSSSTSAGITNDGLQPGSLVVGALRGDIEVGVGFGTSLSKDAAKLGVDCVAQASRELGVRLDDGDRTVGGVVIDDGSQFKKEELLLGVLERNQGLVVVGGGASNEEFMGPGTIGVDGEVFRDGAVTVLFKTPAPWAALRSHAYELMGQRVRITKYDGPTKSILELDGEPAAQRWAQLVGVTPNDFTMANMPVLSRYGFALRVGREHFIRAAFKPDAASDALLSMNWLQEGTELELGKVVDPVAVTKKFFTSELPSRVRNPSAALFFDCEARNLYAKVNGIVEAVSATFREAPPCAGAVVNYESYCGFMVSGTLTSLVFGSDG